MPTPLTSTGQTRRYTRRSGAAPTSEIGTQSATAAVAGGILPWTAFLDYDEHVPELRWPLSTFKFDEMRSDSQINGLMLGTMLPIRAYAWHIDPMGARDEVVAQISEDFGLPVKGEVDTPVEPRPGRFDHDRHLFHALLALVFGHYYFEQVGQIGDDGLWHLHKLAPRPPKTISMIEVAADGGLVAIRQRYGTIANPMPEIPVDRLVAYVWEQEAGNWAGRSLLRPLYKHWLTKDRLLRVDAINHERAGGVPWAEGFPGATRKDLESLAAVAQQFKVGEAAGAAIPSGATLHIAQPTGRSGTSVVDSLHYHDEAMARSMLMMFMQLGQTETGSRALGSEFIDFFALGQQAIANWYAKVTTLHAIADEVAWNWGEDEPIPALGYEREDDPVLATGDLVSLIDAGAVVVDSELEAWLRGRFGMPAKQTGAPAPTPTAAPPAPAAPTAAKTRPTRAATMPTMPDPSTMPLPDRPLRRQPTEAEARSGINFAVMEQTWTAARDDVASLLAAGRPAQIDALHSAIVDAGGDLTTLANLDVDPAGVDEIAARLESVAATAAAAAAEEAQHQGRDVTTPDTSHLADPLHQRAEATARLVADALSGAAAARAIRLSGNGALGPTEVAADVRDHLLSLTDAWSADQLSGAVTGAQNVGREEVWRQNPASTYLASELLDANTCAACSQVDGTTYTSLDDAERDYPGGGFVDCAGGPRCRGTLVAIFD